MVIHAVLFPIKSEDALNFSPVISRFTWEEYKCSFLSSGRKVVLLPNINGYIYVISSEERIQLVALHGDLHYKDVFLPQ
ncbi:hypothetical protein TNCV_258871 [Trichonephila clavipes]|uniref:Uncharacterized protein n=1 Tax=Trichonephila clavipes TaxID=2585209 RepID=A0A8X6RT80_TRICX|nr:hypothetical protein TNCV_258871 [Trichonephila clavipes]